MEEEQKNISTEIEDVKDTQIDRLFNYLKKHDQANTFKIARELRIKRTEVLKCIKELEEKGKITFKSDIAIVVRAPQKEKEETIIEAPTQPVIQSEQVHEVEKQEESEEKYLYVYGIINNQSIKLDVKGLEDKPIEKINFKDIYALTSRYPNLHPTLKEEETLQYADILKKIAEKTTIIPLSFGTVFKDQEILEKVLSKSYLAVKNTLRLIENKIELGVKVIKNQADGLPEELELTQEILEPLNKLSIKSVKGDNFSDRLLLNYAFLVEKNKFSQFSEEIANLEKEYQDLKFVYTGPWPPYSFVNIKITGG